MELLAQGETLPQRPMHPIELVARAYGLVGNDRSQDTRTA
jgi:hypothetical protein